MSHIRLFLLRHAEVEARYQKVFGGRIDMDLSARGHVQADALAAYLRPRRLDALYASPMKRVQQTLVPMLANGMPAPVILPGLREVDFGDWTGHAWDAINDKFGMHAGDWLDHLENGTLSNGEPIQEFRARVDECLREILGRHPNQTVAIVCHGGVIRMMLSILLELPLPRMNAFDIEYASLTELVLMPRRAEIQLLNFTPWRDLSP